MIKKTHAFIIFAVGLLLSVGLAMSQERGLQVTYPANFVIGGLEQPNTQAAPGTDESGSFVQFVIVKYSIEQYTFTSPELEEVASIICYSDGNAFAQIIFLKDDAPNQQNYVSGGERVYLYYPYSRYNDILAILERGDAFVRIESNHPEDAFIRSKQIAS